MGTRDNDPMRRYTFRPYQTGAGPHFILKTWDANKRDSLGKHHIRYVFSIRENGKSVELFKGEDFATPRAIDSIETAHALMRFLTLRPGDTDADYFKDYTEQQRDYCARYAEALSAEIAARWEDQNGNVKECYRR